MLTHIKGAMPEALRQRLSRIKSLYLGELHYLEYNLTDHCNLNCKGCSHFCSVSSPSFADLDRYASDLNRLSQIISNIQIIRLMGGEPLLHDNPVGFIEVTRACFPKSNICFVTNGILLPKASRKFWEVCRRENVEINISAYPPFWKLVPSWKALCQREGVRLTVTKTSDFRAHMNAAGDSEKTAAFSACRAVFNCPNLRNGRLYVCFMSSHIEHFNRRYNTKIEGDTGIDLYDPDISVGKILEYLDTPAGACRWCATEFRTFPWSAYKKNEPILQSDWDADSTAPGGAPSAVLKDCQQ
jgi:hypothetical protein